MSEQKHTPIEEWVEKSVTEWYKKAISNGK